MHKLPLPPEILNRCHALRQNSTDAENLLWSILRNRRLGDMKFRRQVPMCGFILDFYCVEAKLAVELDGGGHLDADRMKYDGDRTKRLEEQGIRVLRFFNHEVLKELDAVVSVIWNAISDEKEINE